MIKNKLKFATCLVAVIVTCFIFVSCSEQQTTTEYSPRELAEVMLATQSDLPDIYPIPPSDDFFDEYLNTYYSISSNGLSDGIICYPNAALANEIAILIYEDESIAETAQQALDEYIEKRAEDFIGYLPEQAFLAEQGEVVRRGGYVALMIGDDSEAMSEKFFECFTSEPPELPETLDLILGESDTKLRRPKQGPAQYKDDVVDDDDEYDPQSIITTWQTGDYADISKKNQLILEFCIDIIEKKITDDMTDFEKELVIHDWIITYAAYDEDASNQWFEGEIDPNNENPYGLLYNKKAICYGYTSTFQLFMDLLEIECISVTGTVAVEDGDPHAWNKVKLDDGWYNVDVTWNDSNSSVYVDHNYFNVTDQYMRETDHVWDNTNLPVAEAYEYAMY